MAFLAFFIAANVFRFRDEGRLCSMEYVNILVTSLEKEWYYEGLFQWRAIVTVYCLGAIGAVIGCIAICRHKRQQRYMY